jgi:hypothetical protein
MPLKRNYAGVASLVAFVCAAGVPTLSLLWQSDFRNFAHHQGPGVLWLLVVWVGAWTLTGIICGVVGLALSQRGWSGRASSMAGLVLNLVFLLLQLRNL